MRDSNRPGALSRSQLASMTNEQFEAWLKRHRITGMAAVAASQKRKAAQRRAALETSEFPPIVYAGER